MFDNYNPKRVLLIFAFIVFVGQVIFSIGVSFKSFPIMLLGRIVFGIGGETTGVAQTAITTLFYSGKQLSFALGMSNHM